MINSPIFDNLSNGFFCEVPKINSPIMPKIVTYSIASVDGRIAGLPNRPLEDEKWDTLPVNDTNLEWWIIEEHRANAILEGSGSFVNDTVGPFSYNHSYGIEKLYSDFLPDKVVDQKGRKGWFVVPDSRGRIRWKHKQWPSEEWEGWHLLILVSTLTPPQYLAFLQDNSIPYLVAGENLVDLNRAFEKLEIRLGVKTIVSQAGGRLNGVLLRRGLIDEVNILIVPTLIGGIETPSLFDAPALETDDWPTRLQLQSSQVYDNGFVWLRYKVEGKYIPQD